MNRKDCFFLRITSSRIAASVFAADYIIIVDNIVVGHLRSSWIAKEMLTLFDKDDSELETPLVVVSVEEGFSKFLNIIGDTLYEGVNDQSHVILVKPLDETSHIGY